MRINFECFCKNIFSKDKFWFRYQIILKIKRLLIFGNNTAHPQLSFQILSSVCPLASVKSVEICEIQNLGIVNEKRLHEEHERTDVHEDVETDAHTAVGVDEDPDVHVDVHEKGTRRKSHGCRCRSWGSCSCGLRRGCRCAWRCWETQWCLLSSHFKRCWQPEDVKNPKCQRNFRWSSSAGCVGATHLRERNWRTEMGASRCESLWFPSAWIQYVLAAEWASPNTFSEQRTRSELRVPPPMHPDESTVFTDIQGRVPPAPTSGHPHHRESRDWPAELELGSELRWWKIQLTVLARILWKIAAHQITASDLNTFTNTLFINMRMKFVTTTTWSLMMSWPVWRKRSDCVKEEQNNITASPWEQLDTRVYLVGEQCSGPCGKSYELRRQQSRNWLVEYVTWRFVVSCGFTFGYNWWTWNASHVFIKSLLSALWLVDDSAAVKSSLRVDTWQNDDFLCFSVSSFCCSSCCLPWPLMADTCAVMDTRTPQATDRSRRHRTLQFTYMSHRS